MEGWEEGDGRGGSRAEIFPATTAGGRSPIALLVLLEARLGLAGRDSCVEPRRSRDPPGTEGRTLAQLEGAGKLTAVITQNIDGLHQAAGSKEVLELHGSVHRNYCTRCRKQYTLDDILATQAVPRCSCGGIIRPDVVLYEESLDGFVLSQAIEHLRHADLLIVGGTSLVVYPAAGLLRYYKGRELVLMNRDATPYDGDASLIIRDPIGKTLEQIRV